jgi:hypothetical protein
LKKAGVQRTFQALRRKLQMFHHDVSPESLSCSVACIDLRRPAALAACETESVFGVGVGIGIEVFKVDPDFRYRSEFRSRIQKNALKFPE